jgi:CheY-like chemotaxis protein
VRSQSGLGIGLPLALRLAQMHGGTIEAKSEGIGKGSEFTLLLFLSANQNSTEAATDIEIPSLKKKILIVDDNQDAADTFGLVLQTLGADVRVAHNGFEALEILPQYEANVLLLDIGMPDMDGYQLARQIRSRFPDRRTPMIALTGWGQDEDRRKAKDAGFDGHLVKPVEVSALQKLLESIESAGPR